MPDNQNKQHNHTPLRALVIILLALLVVAGVSLLPLERWTGGKVKNFNLLSDVLPDSVLRALGSGSADSMPSESVDPALLKAEADAAAVAEGIDSAGNAVYTDTIVAPPLAPRSAPDSAVVIEDYTHGTVGLYHLRQALQQAAAEPARIAVVGDSYIEGDILSQDLRLLLQDAYGGEGVGYVNMHSDFPGFRRSVRQGGNGWKSFQGGKKGAKASYTGLSEQYFMPSSNALSTYKGTDALPHLARWQVSRFLFVAPNATTVMTKVGGQDWVEHPVTGAPDSVQAITIVHPTGELDIRATDRDLVGLGVWLDGASGVSLDCMSSRGYSGVTLANISPGLCRQMGRFIDYDLIILEFGINAISPGQMNYSVYTDRLVRVINHVRNCYPRADILLMGIGDRGQRKGGAVHSMPEAPAMVNAQRDAARRAQCLFWDTREAMGGRDAIVRWTEQRLANKDYIHLTHRGGKELASLLFNALQSQLSK